MFGVLISLRALQSIIHLTCALSFLTYRGLIHRKTKQKAYFVMLWIFYIIASFAVSVLFGELTAPAMKPVHIVIIFAAEILYLLFAFNKKDYKYIICVCALYKVLVFLLKESVVYLFFSKINPNDFNIQLLMVVLEIVIGLIILLLVKQIRDERLFKSLSNQLFSISGKTCITIIFILISAAILGNVIYSADLNPEISVILRGTTIITMDLLLIIVIILLVIHNSVSNYKERYYKGLSQTLSNQLDIQIQHYTQLKEHEEVLAGYRHDHKNLILCLRALLEANEVEQALEYINQMNLRIAPQKSVMDSGNYIADALIAEKMQNAQEHSIEIQFDGFIPSSRIENLDICIILANAVDNAIEACVGIYGSKVIYIRSTISNNLWLLMIQNPVEHTVVIKNNHIKTTKEDISSHGFGLYNIETAVQRNNGQIELECSENTFTSSIAVELQTIN